MNGKFGVAIKWLAVTSFEMRFGNTTVVSDPYITECAGTDLDYTAVENCDIISLGHAHYDHITDIPRLIEKFNPKILLDCKIFKRYFVFEHLLYTFKAISAVNCRILFFKQPAALCDLVGK